MNEVRNLMKPAQVAEWLKVTPAILANWRYLGTGPQFIKLGKSIRYAERDVETWLDNNTRQQT